jgi:tetratricopeptide (TPR) repeat protein
MAGVLGKRGGTSAGATAQDLMYEAWDSSGERRIELALRALETDPDCADGYVLLAEEAGSVEEARELYERGVQAGERSLGRKTFEEDFGHFWGVLETRPYMRARAGLAQCLWMTGEREQAVSHYREMLRLNPNDNQGLRYVLAACLFDLRREHDLEELLTQYEDDASAVWAYSRVLVALRRGAAPAAARKLLEEAVEFNPHVPALLLGKKRLPKQPPGLIGMGDESEAESYAFENLQAWKATPGALEWLAAAIRTGPNASGRRRRSRSRPHAG